MKRLSKLEFEVRDGIIYRKCIHCEIFKKLDDYYKELGKRLGTRAYCKDCHKINVGKYVAKNKEKINLKRIEKDYGLSEEEFNKLKEIQNNVCAICKTTMLVYRGAHIDHDHNSGKVRGLLCMTCNMGVGMFKDSIDLLELAITYLKNNR